MNCPDCGYEIDDGSLLCRKCGAEFKSPAFIPDNSSAAQTEPPPITEIEGIPESSFSVKLEENCPPHIKHFKKGSFFRRALALYFDLLLQGMMVFFFFIGGIAMLNKILSIKGYEMGIENLLIMTGPLLLLSLIINMSYFTFFHWAGGQTPGKKLNNLKVVTIDGESVGLLRSFIRWAGYFLSALPFMLGFLLALIDEENQTLHDKFADTYVVDAALWQEIFGE